MSTETVISMRELEAESAELLPSRETLCCWRSHHGGSGFTQVGNFNSQNALVALNVQDVQVLSPGAGNIIG